MKEAGLVVVSDESQSPIAIEMGEIVEEDEVGVVQEESEASVEEESSEDDTDSSTESGQGLSSL